MTGQHLQHNQFLATQLPGPVIGPHHDSVYPASPSFLPQHTPIALPGRSALREAITPATTQQGEGKEGFDCRWHVIQIGLRMLIARTLDDEGSGIVIEMPEQLFLQARRKPGESWVRRERWTQYRTEIGGCYLSRALDNNALHALPFIQRTVHLAADTIEQRKFANALAVAFQQARVFQQKGDDPGHRLKRLHLVSRPAMRGRCLPPGRCLCP